MIIHKIFQEEEKIKPILGFDPFQHSMYPGKPKEVGTLHMLFHLILEKSFEELKSKPEI